MGQAADIGRSNLVGRALVGDTAASSSNARSQNVLIVRGSWLTSKRCVRAARSSR